MICPQPLTVMQKLSLAVQLGILNDRQVVLQTHPVGEPTQSTGRAQKIPVFMGTIQRCGIVVNVDVGMGPVCVGHHEKSVIALRPAHSQFIADLQRRLRVKLPRRKRLADLIAQHIRVPFLFPACDSLVLGLAQKKLRIGCHRVALVGADQGPVQRLFWIFPIVETVLHGLQNAFAAADVMGFQISCGRGPHLLHTERAGQ